MSDEATAPAGRTSRTVRLVTALPELAAVIPAEDREMAERVLLAPVITAVDTDLAPSLTFPPGGTFDFVAIDGLVLKETTFAARSALELLGPGDILAPPLSAMRQADSRAVSRYLAHGSVTLAALDGRFRQAARRWPGLTDVLHDLLGRQAHRASMHMAMLHQPRVEDRVTTVFVDLAERFGHVTPDGVVIGVPLTHEIIGRLVGSRRPTVSLALQDLATRGVLNRRDDGRWLLAHSAILPPKA